MTSDSSAVFASTEVSIANPRLQKSCAPSSHRRCSHVRCLPLKHSALLPHSTKWSSKADGRSANEEPHNLYAPPDIVRVVRPKEDEMGWTRSMHGSNKNRVQNICRKI